MANITLKPLNIKKIQFTIKGISPLIQHAWSEKALRMMRMTAAERRKQPKTGRDPEGEATSAMYTLNGKPAFPLLAFKGALIGAAHKDLGIEKTLVKKSFFIPANNPDRLIEMECSDPVIREDTVRVGANQTDMRYRPEFAEWRVRVDAEYDADNLSESDIINLVNRAGFGVGVGEWRPEKGGEFGRFKIDTSEPVTSTRIS